MLLQRQGFLCCGCGTVSSAVAAGAGASSWKKAADHDDRESSSSATTAARQLSWAQVEAMTGGFTSPVVGEGGFSTVYLARLAGGSLAAVKVHRSSERVQRAFRQELDALLRVQHHPHIVRLLGFCDQGGVLVLELAPNGNLHDRLHSGGGIAMAWARRACVALQVARALDYLHSLQVVHGDVKASNVLLDADMGARLCDFGSARAGFSEALTRAVLGSPGYVDPHYLRSGLLTKKSDVYSFGVLLLEIVTGMHPFCAEEGRLAVLAPRQINKLVVDPRLGCRYDADEAAAMVALAVACVGDNPSLRPSMADVVRTLQHNSSSSTLPVRTRPRKLL